MSYLRTHGFIHLRYTLLWALLASIAFSGLFQRGIPPNALAAPQDAYTRLEISAFLLGNSSPASNTMRVPDAVRFDTLLPQNGIHFVTMDPPNDGSLTSLDNCLALYYPAEGSTPEFSVNSSIRRKAPLTRRILAMYSAPFQSPLLRRTARHHDGN